MENKTAIIIQARTGSTRLPNKMVIPFHNNLSVLEIIINRIKFAYADKFRIILVTTVNKNDDVICDIGKQNGIIVYRGSEEDVLSRYINSAKDNEINNIVRVCADNPMLNVEHIEEIVKYGIVNKSDYVSYRFKEDLPVIKSHLGLFTEFTTLKALTNINKATSDKFYHEHVTNFIYENKDLFKVDLLNIKKDLVNRDDLRFTLDTESDFKNLQEIYSELGEDNVEDISMLVDLIDTNSKYKRVMKEQISKNSK